MAARIQARLHFHRLDSLITGSEERGEAVLYTNGLVRIRVGKGLKRRLLHTSERLDHGTLLYGATAFMALAAAGAALVLRRKAVAGYGILALAGATALGASGVRAAAKQIPRLFEEAIPATEFHVSYSEAGTLTLAVAGKPWTGAALRFDSGEYDPLEADAFITALVEAK